MDRKRVLEMIKNITEFTDDAEGAKIKHPFSVIGPSGGQNALRIYSYGGAVGRIGLGKGGCTLCDRYYFQNNMDLFTAAESAEINKWIEKSGKKDKEITGKWIGDILDSELYLTIVLKAVKKKSGKKDGSDKERNIQMEILSKGNKGRSDWNIIDVETGVTKKWVNSPDIINVKRPDFVVYDRQRRQFGIIELKVDNENTGNLGDHYSLFHALYKNPDRFVKELSSRAEVMAEYGLVYNDLKNIKEKVWFGFLFVGGGINGAKKCIENNLLGKKEMTVDDIETDCRFMYADTAAEVEDIGLCYEHMLDIQSFMNE